MQKKKIGILYIATGRYTIFWDEFYKSCQEYFLPNHEKHYFVFTDSIENINTDKGGVVEKIYQKKLGWPYDTLMRFEIFLKAEEQLKEMDYIFFFNANMELIARIDDADIFAENKGLIGAKHPIYYDKTNKEFPYDRNPDSLACIPMGEGEYYCMGGLNGGKTADYLQLVHTLRDNIQADLDKNVIALWHDESHINNYFWKHRDNLLVLSEKYGVPEEGILRILLYGYKNFKVSTKNIGGKIVIRNKAHYRYGGHQYLRGQTDKKIKPLILIIKEIWKFVKRRIS